MLTVTFTVAGSEPWFGTMTVIWVPAALIETVEANVLPNFTELPGVKFVPVMISLVPPLLGPVLMLTPVTLGAGT